MLNWAVNNLRQTIFLPQLKRACGRTHAQEGTREAQAQGFPRRRLPHNRAAVGLQQGPRVGRRQAGIPGQSSATVQARVEISSKAGKADDQSDNQAIIASSNHHHHPPPTRPFHHPGDTTFLTSPHLHPYLISPTFFPRYNKPAQHVPPPPRPRHVPQAGGHRHRAALRQVRRQVPRLRLVRAAHDARAHLRRVQLRQLPEQVRRLRRRGHQRRLLLPRVHAPREGPRRLPQDHQPGQLQDGREWLPKPLSSTLLLLRAAVCGLRMCADCFDRSYSTKRKRIGRTSPRDARAWAVFLHNFAWAFRHFGGF